MTMANDLPGASSQELHNGVVLQWVAEGVLRIDPLILGTRHLLISAGVHGNETAPVEILDRWLRRIVAGEIVPRQSLMLMLGNPAALRAGTRYIERDMNRLFNGAHLLGLGFEGRRAALLERLASSFFEGPLLVCITTYIPRSATHDLKSSHFTPGGLITLCRILNTCDWQQPVCRRCSVMTVQVIHSQHSLP